MHAYASTEVCMDGMDGYTYQCANCVRCVRWIAGALGASIRMDTIRGQAARGARITLCGVCRWIV